MTFCLAQEQRAKAAKEAEEVDDDKPVAKSMITFTILPRISEPNLGLLEGVIRRITADGLTWDSSKFIPLGDGYESLDISAVFEVNKVCLLDLPSTLLVRWRRLFSLQAESAWLTFA